MVGRGRAERGPECKEKGEMIPILALLENGKVIAAQRPSRTACLPTFLRHSLQLLVYGRSSIFVLYEQSAS